MTHTAKDGSPKIVEQCALRLTGAGCVNRVVTDVGGLDITDEGLPPVETAPGVEVEEAFEKTTTKVRVVEEIRS